MFAELTLPEGLGPAHAGMSWPAKGRDRLLTGSIVIEAGPAWAVAIALVGRSRSSPVGARTRPRTRPRLRLGLRQAAQKLGVIVQAGITGYNLLTASVELAQPDPCDAGRASALTADSVRLRVQPQRVVGND